MARDIDPEHTAFLVGDIARHFRATFEDAITDEKIGLTTSEARVLTQIARGGPRRQSDLADLLCAAPMSVSVFLDGLERAGLVRRDPDPADRRAKIVSLTPASSPVLSRIAGIGARVQAAALDGIDPDDQAVFATVARQIRRNLETLRGMGTDREMRERCGAPDAGVGDAGSEARDARGPDDAREAREAEET